MAPPPAPMTTAVKQQPQHDQYQAREGGRKRERVGGRGSRVWGGKEEVGRAGFD